MSRAAMSHEDAPQPLKGRTTVERLTSQEAAHREATQRMRDLEERRKGDERFRRLFARIEELGR